MPEKDGKSAREESKLKDAVSQTTDSAKAQTVQAGDAKANAPRTEHQENVGDASLEQIQQDSEQIEQSLHTTCDKIREVGGRDGPDPVRYGDWEKGGRCIDF